MSAPGSTVRYALVVFAVASFVHVEDAAADVKTFNAVSINSAHAVNFAPLDFLRNDTGAAVELQDLDERVWAVGDDAGGFAFKPILGDLYGKASLADGQLKAYAKLGYGTNQPNSAPMPLGAAHSNASTRVSFGDSFNAVSGGSPYLWTGRDVATLRFAVSGQTNVPPGLADPVNNDPGQPRNQLITELAVHVYRPGGLQKLYELETFDFNAYPDFDTAFAAFLVINAELNALKVANDFWYFGDFIAPFDAPAGKLLPASSAGTNVSFEFMPNGDFEWWAMLSTTVRLDASLQNTSAALDFADTLVASYDGPAGTITQSASGVFPGTVPVPEPSAAAAAGVLALAWSASRRRATRGAAA